MEHEDDLWIVNVKRENRRDFTLFITIKMTLKII